MVTRRTTLLAGALLALLAVALYAPTARHGFVNLDDDAYVVLNPRVNAGLRAANVAWAFTGTACSNWHPLTWISHMLDVQLYGLMPRGHHLTNVALHAANTVLLLLLWRGLTGSLWRSALVAALFAVHPLHVESVAWIAERKDLLSTLLGLLAALAYLGHLRRPRPVAHALALCLFALALMAKPMLVTLPLLLLVLDVWPLGRLGGPAGRRAALRRLVVEKAPWAALSLGSAAITLSVQSASGAVRPGDVFPVSERLANALVSGVAYAGAALWPARLAVYYPHPGGSLPAWQGAVAAALLAAASAAAWRAARRRPHLAAGWLWFLLSLAPVIGIVQVGTQARADRYTYLPLTGLFVALAWSLPRAARAPRSARRTAASAAAVVALLALAARIQTAYWRDSLTLLGRALDVVSDGHPGQAPPRSMLLLFNLEIGRASCRERVS
jgi:hypothetical protein